ncbi:MAG: hypothetical protein PHE78_00205 [Candidatus Gastranaerophilales bacterium]|nr:hypothetical protein [Candidatus Gastranaerophilales bacterium]
MCIIEVVYLSRGSDYGLSAFLEFLDAYKKYSAGVEHKLTVIAKGWENKKEEYERLTFLSKENGINIFDLSDDGLDLGAYIRFAKISESDNLFFFSTSTVINANNWLLFFYNVIKNKHRNKYLLLGPNGSWESPAENNMLLLKNILFKKISILKKLRRIIKLLLNPTNIVYFKSSYLNFPNYHIRTNCFLVDRKIFLKYAESIKFPSSKADTYAMEHGNKSLTKWFLNKGYNVGVINSDGELFPPEKWDKSGTFRTPDGCKSITQDKHSKIYYNATLLQKRTLEKAAWGKEIS